jgi:acid phosphatase (class A)
MKRLPAFLVILALVATASAAPFLSVNPLDLPALLPPPPAVGSPAALAELDTVLQAQTARTPAQAARCVQIEHETIWLFGADVLGPWFTAAHLPKTAAFFAAVRDDFIPVNRAAKALHPRQRPPFADPRIKPCVEFADTGSYPSGHGIQSSLWAALLAEIFPDHAAGFAQRAGETRHYKLLSGVHYPSDLAAGQARRRGPGPRAAEKFPPCRRPSPSCAPRRRHRVGSLFVILCAWRMPINGGSIKWLFARVS